MADDQRARLIRDLDQAARTASDCAATIDRLFRNLMESDDPDLSARDTVQSDQAIQEVLRALPELRRIFAKWARLLDGPPPRLAIRATDEPERLGIIARYPSGDLAVGDAKRTGSGDSADWQIRLTDHGRPRGSIGLCWGASVDELLEGVNHRVEEHGPWWTTVEGRIEEAPSGASTDPAEGSRRTVADLILAAAGRECTYCGACPGVPCTTGELPGYHVARFLGLLASPAEVSAINAAAEKIAVTYVGWIVRANESGSARSPEEGRTDG